MRADRGWSRLPYRILGLVLLGLIWQWAAHAKPSLLFPTATTALRSAVDLLGEGEFWSAFATSNRAMVIGFAISLAITVPVSLLMARLHLVGRIIDVYVSLLLVVPIAAVIPLLIMSLGIGDTSQVILIILFCLPVMVIDYRAGVRSVDSRLIEMARSFGASELQIWLRVLLPGSLPALMLAIRIGIGRAIDGMVVAELLLIATGLGGLVVNYRSEFESGRLWATILLVIVEALLLVSLARWAERKVQFWSGSADAGSQRKLG
jgi:NitT/TauT family transport system permease protein